jgi:hypothetical protein
MGAPRVRQRVPGALGDASVLAPVLIALAFFVLLAAFAGVDPAPGVTASTSPWTDEGWNVLNARDLLIFGRWSTDVWDMYVVNFPFSVLQAAWLAIAGIGIVQARLLVIAIGALALAAIGLGLRRPLGGTGAALAEASLGGSALVLYYGRLAYLEPMVVLWLVLGLLPLVREKPSFESGLVAGIALALAIATKASAGAAVAGMVAGFALVGLREPGVRRALAGVMVAALGVAIVWAAVFVVPQPAALATDLRIWASEPLPRSLAQLISRIGEYPRRSDGGIPLALPLLVAGAVGVIVVTLRRRSLDARQRRLAAACAGWFAVGISVLLIVPYRPNRYLVPLLPPLAIVAGLAFALAVSWISGRTRRGGRAGAGNGPDDVELTTTGASRLAGWNGGAVPAAGAAALPGGVPGLRPGGLPAALPAVGPAAGAAALPGGVPGALALVLGVVLVLPGLVTYAGWVTSTPSTLPGIQARIASIVPAGAAVQGDLAPVLAMGTRAETIVSRPETNVNGGDLYATRGVRWVLTTGAPPQWAALHPAAWAARTRELCLSWGPGRTCLYRLP